VNGYNIFKDDADRESFVERFGKIMGDTETGCPLNTVKENT
jgi:hypothetical protein